ncbi:MAG: hypothetical protein RSC68_24295, partial [Acinetobacter sp.]
RGGLLAMNQWSHSSLTDREVILGTWWMMTRHHYFPSSDRLFIFKSVNDYRLHEISGLDALLDGGADLAKCTFKVNFMLAELTVSNDYVLLDHIQMKVTLD